MLLKSLSHQENFISENVWWDIILQFNIFCGPYASMGKAFKQEYNDLLGLLWRGPGLVLKPKFSCSMSARSTLMILRLHFGSEVSFFPLPTQLLFPPTKCPKNTTSRMSSRPPSTASTGCDLSVLLCGLSTPYIHTYGFGALSQADSDVRIPYHTMKKSKETFHDIIKWKSSNMAWVLYINGCKDCLILFLISLLAFS